jgi:hypothetical protein
VYMKNRIAVILLFALVVCSCEVNNDDEIPPSNLPPTVFGQLPTRSAIIQAAEAVGATNVQIISYQRANGTALNAGGVTTNGGYQPSWWRQDRRWSGNTFPTLVAVSVVYDETNKMHPSWSVRQAILQLLNNAGFYDANWHSSPLEVTTTTDNGMRLIPLPTHASIINSVEQLGARNIRIHRYLARSVDYWSPPPITFPGDPIAVRHMHIVPADRNFNARQRNPGTLWFSYEHPGLGSIITNNDVQNVIRELFIQYGFEGTDVATTGTLISASFPLPSYDQIRNAAVQAGANNVLVSTYRANNINVIPMNEGIQLANIPIIIEINYDLLYLQFTQM